MGYNRYKKMKKTLLIVLATIIATASFAQLQLATLNHNDSITVFYGIDALVSAHNMAENGDIITLSSGIFNTTTITKSVTIRGAGAWMDDSGNTNTVLLKPFTIDVPNDSIHYLTLEGLFVANDTYYKQVYNPQFVKCYFNRLTDWGNGSFMHNAIFINCILEGYYNQETSSGWRAQNSQFNNSVVLSSSFSSPDRFTNCILKQSPDISSMSNRLFLNCILYYNWSETYGISDNSYTAYNCIFVQLNPNSYTPYNLFSGQEGHILWVERGMNNIFQYFDGNYDGINFELIDTIATSCIGIDGTQVGVYGGMMPFNPKVNNPIIRSINVGKRSTPDGKLAVDIEVISDDTQNNSSNDE